MMTAVDCTNITLSPSQAAAPQRLRASSECRLHPRGVESVSELRSIMAASITCSYPVMFAVAWHIRVDWRWLCDSVGAAIVSVGNRAVSLVLTIDGRDPVANLVVRHSLASLGVDLPADVTFESMRHGLVVATLPTRVIDNSLVSILPFGLIYPAFAECRGLP